MDFTALGLQNMSEDFVTFFFAFFDNIACLQVIGKFVKDFTKSRITGRGDSNADQLLCQCPSLRNVSGVQECVNGSDIKMAWQFWAGEANSSSGQLSDYSPLQYLSNITVSIYTSVEHERCTCTVLLLLTDGWFRIWSTDGHLSLPRAIINISMPKTLTGQAKDSVWCWLTSLLLAFQLMLQCMSTEGRISARIFTINLCASIVSNQGHSQSSLSLPPPPHNAGVVNGKFEKTATAGTIWKLNAKSLFPHTFSAANTIHSRAPVEGMQSLDIYLYSYAVCVVTVVHQDLCSCAPNKMFCFVLARPMNKLWGKKSSWPASVTVAFVWTTTKLPGLYDRQGHAKSPERDWFVVHAVMDTETLYHSHRWVGWMCGHLYLILQFFVLYISMF